MEQPLQQEEQQEYDSQQCSDKNDESPSKKEAHEDLVLVRGLEPQDDSTTRRQPELGHKTEKNPGIVVDVEDDGRWTMNKDYYLSADLRLAMELQDEELTRQAMEKSRLEANHQHQHHQHDLEQQQREEQRRRQRQEEQEEKARTLQEIRLLQIQDQNEQEAEENRKLWNECWTRIVPAVACVFVITLTVTLLFVFDVIGPKPFSWNDVSNMDDTNSQLVWDPASHQLATGGLQLTIINALDESWQPYFQTVVQRWDNGTPDVLQLSTITILDFNNNNNNTTVSDESCDPVTGHIIVCNDDYGDTHWRGSNHVIWNKRTKEITASAAKLNDYYLLTASEDAKEYALCHELGHGFGLPHWDTDLKNEDLGNCMDYTQNPSQNKFPSRDNFEYLENLYGTITAPKNSNNDNNNNDPSATEEGGRILKNTRAAQTDIGVSHDENESYDIQKYQRIVDGFMAEWEKKHSENGVERRRRLRHEQSIPQDQNYNEQVRRRQLSLFWQTQHVLDLGDDHVILIQLLLPATMQSD